MIKKSIIIIIIYITLFIIAKFVKVCSPPFLIKQLIFSQIRGFWIFEPVFCLKFTGQFIIKNIYFQYTSLLSTESRSYLRHWKKMLYMLYMLRFCVFFFTNIFGTCFNKLCKYQKIKSSWLKKVLLAVDIVFFYYEKYIMLYRNLCF